MLKPKYRWLFAAILMLWMSACFAIFELPGALFVASVITAILCLFVAMCIALDDC